MQSFALMLVFAAALVASLLVKFWLATRQMRHVAAHRDAVPAAFANTITLTAHQKAADYTLAKGRLGLLSTAFGAAVLLGWTLLGGLDLLNVTLRDAIEPRFGGMAYQLALLAAFALIGGVWLLYFLGHNLSVAGAVGFLALAGLAAEFGVVMLLYLRHAWDRELALGRASEADLLSAIRSGAVLRVRPKAMTVAVILAGLFPIMWGAGTGSEVMQRIAAPMVGGMLTAPLLSMFVIPAAYMLLRRRRTTRAHGSDRQASER